MSPPTFKAILLTASHDDTWAQTVERNSCVIALVMCVATILTRRLCGPQKRLCFPMPVNHHGTEGPAYYVLGAGLTILALYRFVQFHAQFPMTAAAEAAGFMLAAIFPVDADRVTVYSLGNMKPETKGNIHYIGIYIAYVLMIYHDIVLMLRPLDVTAADLVYPAGLILTFWVYLTSTIVFSHFKTDFTCRFAGAAQWVFLAMAMGPKLVGGGK